MGGGRVEGAQLRLTATVSAACTDDLRRIWQNVVLQAIRDATTQPIKDRKDSIIAHREARIWLDGQTAEFNEVCTLAGIDPEAVRRWWRERRG